MYTDEIKSVSPSDQIKKAPYYYEAAQNFLAEIASLPHDDQVDCFKYLQRQLADTRIQQNAVMQKESAELAELIKSHNEGTDKIASGL